MDTDPYAWLEDVDGERALAWVRERNAEATAALTGTDFDTMRTGILEVLDSDAKIPGVGKAGELFYNFWRDALYERGIWRRTSLDSYRTDEPEWEVLLDLDALSAAEDVSWVWHGAQVLRPDCHRALVTLSRGGSDADVTREFDLETLAWVVGGFERPESKGGMSWIDEDSVFVFTDTGPGSLTTSGYPRTVRRWHRGTPLDGAELIYEGLDTDLYISALHDRTPGYERDVVVRSIAFYREQVFLLAPDGTLARIDVPESADVGLKREWLTIELRDPWEVEGTTHPAGALLAAPLDGFLAGRRSFDVLFTPSPTTSLAGASWTRHHLVINVLDDVKNRLEILTPGPDGWVRAPFTGAPAVGTVAAGAVDPDSSDELWLTATDYLTPTTLSLATITTPETGTTTRAAPTDPIVTTVPLKSMPVFFDPSTHVAEQHTTGSADGTRVPYFLVRPRDLVLDGTAPTLLHGYGGFEISLTPGYSGGLGRAWLSRGGVYVVANIRGGGEYGPRWHQEALRENRHRAYEDFAAVAQDLVRRGVTSPAHLGIQGGSNGGLLTGNMLVQYPELVGAVVVQVPLLDMKRYSHLLAGASWMAEYGDPDDPAQWEYIRTFSPYHLVDAGRDYPPVLFTTSTRDDRVHPGHARKMAARLLDAGKEVLSYENIEGGHGGAATNAQSAYMSALAYSFLWKQLA